MGRQLTDVDVKYISLVKKGANNKPITIYKSADYKPEEPENQEPTGVVKETTTEATAHREDLSQLGKFFTMMKNFFAGGKEEVVKAQDINTVIDYTSFNSIISSVRGNFNKAIYALEEACWEIFWDGQITNGKERILQNIDEFKTYVASILNNDSTVQKSFFTRDTELAKQAVETLKSITDGLSETINKSNKGGEEMNQEEMQALLNPIVKSVESLATKVDSLAEAVAKTEAKVEEKTAEVAKDAEAKVDEKTAEVAKAAEEGDTKVVELLTGIQKSLDGISSRVSTLEQYRGETSQIDGQEATVSKDLDDEEAFWADGGIL